MSAALSVACPRCGAAAGSPCVGAVMWLWLWGCPGDGPVQPHAARRRAAAASVSASIPTSTPSEIRP